jgi:transposase-like protein
VGQLLGFAKSTLCKWLQQEPPVEKGSLGGEVVELDGLWTRSRAGGEELKVARDEGGSVFLSFGGWEQVIERLYEGVLGEPAHVVSDGDPAIAGAIELAYGIQTPHQLCQFHLLREYRRNVGKVSWAEAKALLESQDWEEAQQWAQRLSRLTGGKAGYWCDKALEKGLTYLRTGQAPWRTTSRLERFNRELRRRERLGTCWSPHNLTVLLARRIQLTSTT